VQPHSAHSAVTRGKKRVVLTGQPKAINIAIHNDKTDLRHTHLATRLRHAIRLTAE